VPEENEVEMEPTESVDNPEASTEVLEEPGDLYTVKIDGEEQQVTLEELQNGYQRGADYTRKTQAVAEERDRLRQAEALMTAVQEDPAGTIQALSKSFGVDNPIQTESSMEDWEEVDPNIARIAALEQKIEQQEAVQRKLDLEREVNALQEEYGEFDTDELLGHALKHRIGNLEAAFKHWRFDQTQDALSKLQAEQEITEKKRDAAVVTPGGSTQAGTEPSPMSSPPLSVREAFERAKQELST
tara:strand:+ start:3547 stop:4275 length:729 start_codon:yes stop_codon:yes gene_type:complete